MSIKDLFENKKVLTSQNLEKTALDIETPEYLGSVAEDKLRFEPHVDYSDPANFVRFASAEMYYKDSFERIYRTYPFDGSGKEKQDWFNSGSLFDKYVYDKLYPKISGGYIEFDPDPGDTAYIQVKGVMNTGSSFANMVSNFSGSNIYDPDKDRGVNLRINPEKGNTVEFWMKAYDPQPTNTSCIFSLEDSIKQKFSISLDNLLDEFVMSYSGSLNGFLDENIAAPAGVNFTEWNHFAFSVFKDSSDLKIEMFVNGEFKKTEVVVGTSFVESDGPLQMHIGSKGGTNQFAGCLDEFRYWRTRRTHEEIGRFWFTNVNGGSNTDDSYIDLGLYLKFNEGETGIDSVDKTFLDYSGRTSHGKEVNSGTSRIARHFSNSPVPQELPDPIIYSFHPDVQSQKAFYEAEGEVYDSANSNGLHNNLPAMLFHNETNTDLHKLLQVMGAYYDSLYLMIKDIPATNQISYTSGSNKPYPFSDRMLLSRGFIAPEIFEDADALNQIYARDEDRLFEDKVHNIKNTIYNNINNNLVEIYKTKGTEQSFRNLMHCFGVDENLVGINYYANFQEFELEDRYQNSSQVKNFVNFNHIDKFESSIFQQTSSLYPDSFAYIHFDADCDGTIPFTAECELIVPNANVQTKFSTDYPHLSSSVFGFVTPNITEGSTDWATVNNARLGVYVVRDKVNSDSGYFVLSGTLSSGSFLEMKSNLIENLYSEQKWNVSVACLPVKKYTGMLSGSSGSDYAVKFYGVNTVLDSVIKEFSLEQIIDTNQILSTHKRFYAGARRTNFTGSVTHFSDIKLGGLRSWMTYVPENVIKLHARDPGNFGAEYALRDEYFPLTDEDECPDFEYEQDKLLFNWVFTDGQIANDGSFIVLDSTYSNRDILYTAVGTNFPSGADISDKVYLSTGRQVTPDNINSKNMVEILNFDRVNQTQNSKPIKYYISFEKSMYRTISEEMLKWFGSIKEFHSLIGAPKNRYSFEYHDMSKLKNLFFMRVNNEPDLERFIEFYKWIDSSLSKMLLELVPASAAGARVRNIIESHLLERNKYWNKLPTIEYKSVDPDDNIRGIGQLKYKWKIGHHPLSESQDDNCLWWKRRWDKEGTVSEEFMLSLQKTHYEKLKNEVITIAADESVSTINFGININSPASFSIPLLTLNNKEECDE